MFTDPYGTSEIVDGFETVLLIVSGFGIAVTIPYLKKMIHGYNTYVLHVPRLHLVWQIELIGKKTLLLLVRQHQH
jgi:hypothetical protein